MDLSQSMDFATDNFIKKKKKKLICVKESLINSWFKICQLTKYRIYSSDYPGRSFNFGFLKGRGEGEGVLIRRKRSFEGGAH